MRRRGTADADKGPLAAKGLALDVAARPPAPNQLQLTQERRELARPGLPHDLSRQADDLSCLGSTAARAKIAQQPCAQTLRLAHVDQLAVNIEHPIDAWFARAQLAHVHPKLRRFAPVNMQR